MIDGDRQNELTQRLATLADPLHDKYPFKDFELSRDDIAWLLEFHSQDLDLRGAILRQVNLSGLTFLRLRGGLTSDEAMQIVDPDRQRSAVQAAAIQMQGANLRSTQFIEATLSHAHLQEADLTDARLISCDLMHTRLDQARLNNAQILSCHLEHAHLSRVRAIGTKFEHARLSDIHANEATFRGAHFVHVQFSESDLKFANFRGAHLEYADFYHAQLQHSIFEGADIRFADFRFADLSDANLKRVCAEQALFSHASMRGTDLGEAWLEFAQLDNARCAGADLRSTNLNGANCQNTDFTGADFRKAFLYGTNFNRCILCDANMEDIHLGALYIDKKPHVLARKKTHTLAWQTDLRRALFDSDTRLKIPSRRRKLDKRILRSLEKWRIDLADKFGIKHLLPAAMTTSPFLKTGLHYVLVADARWNGVSFHSIEWRHVRMFGDEFLAEQGGYRSIDQMRDAAKAYYQMSVELHAQGQDPDAGHFEFRAQSLQRRILRRQGLWGPQIGAYWVSLLIALLTGYGYKVERSVLAYVFLNAVFSGAYLYLTMREHIRIAWQVALFYSITSFHGRGIVPQSITLHDPELIVSSIEAIVGFLIEISFIVTYTKRFFRQ